MAGYSNGRRLRKRKRQLKQAFISKPRKYHRWRWYDWAFCLLAVLLLFYALVSTILASIWIHNYRHPAQPPARPRIARSEWVFIQEIQTAYYDTVGIPLAVSFLIAQFYLVALMIFVLVWLRYLRNFGHFVIICILLLVGSILFFTIAGVSTEKTANQNAVRVFVYDYVTDKLRHEPGMMFALSLQNIYQAFNCCGIRDYRDYVEWNPIIKWPSNNNSVPNECCRNHTPTQNTNWNSNECGNIDILPLAHSANRLSKIYTIGCAGRIQQIIWEGKEFWKFMLYGFIVAILLLIFLLLLMCLMDRVRDRSRFKYGYGMVNPYEQEDLAESNIIPGTPGLSMLSESENTFYAP